jgi:glycosyltransferase involved in cell wall biosynthesis
MNPIKVAHITSLHRPDDPRMGIKEYGALADAGFDVVIICPESTHPAPPGRVVKYVPLQKTRMARMTRTVTQILRAAIRERAQVYHFHDPELLPVAPLLRLTGGRVIYDVHEDLPGSTASKMWIPWLLRRPLAIAVGAVEWGFARMLNGVVAATPHIARRFPPNRTVVVQNFSMVDELQVGQSTPYQSREPLFVYIGAMGKDRGAFEMVRAIGETNASTGARLFLGGHWNEAGLLESLSAMSGWSRVEKQDWQTREQIALQLDRARAGLVVIHPTGNYTESYPVKVFEYMAAGLPIIVSDFPLWRRLFEDVKCAIFVDPRDASALARAMEWILANPEEAERMGARGRDAVRQRFNWQAEAKKLVSFYRDMVLEHHPGTVQLSDV